MSHFRDHITNAKALDIKVLVCFFLFLGHIAQTECKDVASCYSCSMGQSVCVCVSVCLLDTTFMWAQGTMCYLVLAQIPLEEVVIFFWGHSPYFKVYRQSLR